MAAFDSTKTDLKTILDEIVGRTNGRRRCWVSTFPIGYSSNPNQCGLSRNLCLVAMIGGKAPSKYLDQIRNHAQVQISIGQQDDILTSHLIDPVLLRADNFARSYEARKRLLLSLIESAMGKSALPIGGDAPPEDAEDEEDAEE
jgi:hypothetical protein